MRRWRLGVAVLPFLLAAGQALATDAAYIAARDRAIASLGHERAAKVPDSRIDAHATRLTAAMGRQLRALIGPGVPTGFKGPGTLQPETLLPDELGAGSLDGISYEARNGDGSVLVTTEGLLRAWLASRKSVSKEANPPADPAGAFRTEAFYTQAVSPDAAVPVYAVLPIRTPQAAVAAIGLLVEPQQDYATTPPTELAVSVIAGGRAYVALVPARAKVPVIAACTAVWTEFKARADAKLKAYQESKQKDEASLNASTALEEQGAAALRACYGEHLARDPVFPTLTAEAQALADGFARR